MIYSKINQEGNDWDTTQDRQISNGLNTIIHVNQKGNDWKNTRQINNDLNTIVNQEGKAWDTTHDR